MVQCGPLMTTLGASKVPHLNANIGGSADPGLIGATGDPAAAASAFLAALAKHRHFERETDPPAV